MRILLISHGYPPDSVGGVEQHTAGLAQALAEAGHQVTVYAKIGSAERTQGTLLGPSKGNPSVCRVVYRYDGLDGLTSLYEVPALHASLDRLLEAHEFDVAHAHHLTGMSTGLVEVLRRHGVPVVMTLHDYWLMCPRGQMWRDDGTVCASVEPERCAECLRPTFGGWVPRGEPGERVVTELHDRARSVLNAADRLVVPSARAIPPFTALGIDPKRITVIENGVDTAALRAVPPLPEERTGPLRVGFLGTLIPSKGLDVLVDALLQLPIGKVRLDIWGNAIPYHGDGSYLTRVFAKLHPSRPRVAYHGPYHTNELPTLLGKFHVLAAPALWNEAFGLTVREALAAGRPVVASRIGGLRDAFEDGSEGVYTAPGAVDELAAALRSLVEDPARVTRMASACRRRPAPRGFAEMAADLESLYLDCAGLERDRAPT